LDTEVEKSSDDAFNQRRVKLIADLLRKLTEEIPRQMREKPKRSLMEQIDELIAGAEKARLAGDVAASIALAVGATQLLQLQKALDRMKEARS